MEDPRQTFWRPVRWLLVRIAAFMMGVAASGGPAGVVRSFRDPDVREQISANRQSAKRDKATSKWICESTDPAARAMLVKTLVAMGSGSLPEPQSYALRAATGFVHEQINDTRNDSLTPHQERNVFERTSRRMSYMRMCIGTGAAFMAYIEAHNEAVANFIRPSGVTTQQLLDTITVIGSNVKRERATH